MDYSMASGLGNIAATMIGNMYSNKVADIQADAANYVRGQNKTVIEAENKRDAVITGMQKWRQNVGNSRVFENAASDQEMMAVNFQRARDNRKHASFSDQIRYAEEEGRLAASAAFSGVTGSVVDMLNQTSHLRKAMEETSKAKAEATMDYDYGRAQFSQWWANMDQMDYSLILDNPRIADTGTNTAKTTSVLTGVSTKDMKNVAQGVQFMFKTADAPTAAIDPWAGTDHVN